MWYNQNKKLKFYCVNRNGFCAEKNGNGGNTDMLNKIFDGMNTVDIIKELLLTFLKCLGVTAAAYAVGYFVISLFYRSALISSGTEQMLKAFKVITAVAFVVYWLITWFFLRRRTNRMSISSPETHFNWMKRRGLYEILFLLVLTLLCAVFGVPEWRGENSSFTNFFAGPLMLTTLLKNWWLGGILHMLAAFCFFALYVRVIQKSMADRK